jgi:F-type H+-transporting ATPase subunit b
LRKWIIPGATIGAVLLTAGAALGAEQGGSSWAAWKDFGWRMLNFIIFVAIIYKFIGQRTKEFFSGRRQQISSELQDLEDRKADAEKRLQEVERSIANLEQERKEILDQAKQQGETIRQSIIAKANENAERIKEQAQVKASQEMQQMVDELREQMADQIIDSAQRIIASRLGKEEQDKLIDEYLTKVVVN